MNEKENERILSQHEERTLTRQEKKKANCRRGGLIEYKTWKGSIIIDRVLFTLTFLSAFRG